MCKAKWKNSVRKDYILLFHLYDILEKEKLWRQEKDKDWGDGGKTNKWSTEDLWGMILLQ